MSICNTTMCIARRHPFYLVIYVLMLSLLGLILSSSTAADSPQTSYSSYSTRLVLVDRDDSELSRALHDHLDEMCRLIDIADDEYALQDALATGNAGCVIIIPPNWGASVIQAVRAGEEIPALSCALGYSPQAGALVAQDCARWTSLTASALVLEPSTSITDAIIRTTHAMSTQADLQVIATSSAARATGQFQSYLQFSLFSLTSSVLLCAGVVLCAFGNDELRRRTAVAPVSPAQVGLKQLVGCAVGVLIIWAWTCAIGLVRFSGVFAEIGYVRVTLACAALLVYAFIPLVIAYVFTRFSAREDALTAFGTILGLVLSFLGGSWISLDVMGQTVQAIARVTPSFWVSSAIATALSSADPLPAVVMSTTQDSLIVILFIVALGCIGLAVAHIRQREV